VPDKLRELAADLLAEVEVGGVQPDDLAGELDAEVLVVVLVSRKTTGAWAARMGARRW
jgi:hypothetical protein